MLSKRTVGMLLMLTLGTSSLLLSEKTARTMASIELAVPYKLKKNVG